MNNASLTPALSRLHDFFQSTGRERLDGLDASYFADLSTSEQKQAWDFLKEDFYLSEDQITGLYLLNPNEAIKLFLDEINTQRKTPEYPAEVQADEDCKILMLRYICKENPSQANIDHLAKYSNSSSSNTRTKVAQSLPTQPTTQDAITALKGMIYTETERLPLSVATEKLMAIYGLEFDQNDSNYKSIYMGLRSPELDKKNRGFAQLERLSTPKLTSSEGDN